MIKRFFRDHKIHRSIVKKIDWLFVFNLPYFFVLWMLFVWGMSASYYSNSLNDKFDITKAGTGGSDLPDLKAEFSDVPHLRGTLSMARSQDPNSANSQFFICFADASHLDRNYTVFGKVLEGMEFIDNITRGDGPNGAVKNPDVIISMRSK